MSTKNNLDIYGQAVTQKQVTDLKNSLRGHFLSNMLADAFEENVQFGGFYKVDKFMRALDNNAETLKKLYPDVADRVKLENLQTTLGFAQGRISDISGIPGGVLIQLKQAGAAGQLLQFGGGLFSPANVAIGGAAAAGGILPALGVLIAPKYVGKAMLDPKFQQLVFKSAVEEVVQKTNTPKKMQSVYNQMHSLTEFTDPKNYKTYDELKTKLARVLGEEMSMGAPTMAQESQMNIPEPAPEYRVAEPVTAEEVKLDDTDDTMSYFAKLANDD